MGNDELELESRTCHPASGPLEKDEEFKKMRQEIHSVLCLPATPSQDSSRWSLGLLPLCLHLGVELDEKCQRNDHPGSYRLMSLSPDISTRQMVLATANHHPDKRFTESQVHSNC